VLASITRLTAQKGIDLIIQVAGDVLATGAYIVSLGSGEKHYEEFWQRLRDLAPKQVGIYRGYSEPLSHRIEAGADMFLMPSKFEPCGLNQMYSLRYGTVPIVRAVGGLDDTVETFDAVGGSGNGFKFGPYRADKFLERIYEAIFAFNQPKLWRTIQHNGMAADNSWETAAKKYVELYNWTLHRSFSAQV
jgi:starch synthase